MKRNKKVNTAGTLGLIALLSSYSLSAMSDEPAPPAPPATAQEQSRPKSTEQSGEIQQVTITAQRRATLLKDTPISVQAVTAQQLDNDGIRSIDDLTRIMPGVNFNRSGTSATGNYNDEDSEIAVRGIASSAGASTTGIYIDDTPIQTRHLSFGSVAPFPAIFDLDRVEMLRGPQGTLFGAGSEGGAVRFIQPEPSLNEESRYAHAEVGSAKSGAPSYEAGVSIGEPLMNDLIGLRLSFSTRKDGGYVDRVNVDPVTGLVAGTAEANANWEATNTMRAAVKVAASKDTSIIASVYHQELKLNDTGAYWASLSDRSNSKFLNGNAQANSSNDPFTLWAIKVNSDLGWARLTSSTSYFSRNQTGVSDYTQFLGSLADDIGFPGTTPYASGPNSLGTTGTAYFTDQQHNAIEELRLQSVDPRAKLTWVAGLFLSRQDENTTERMDDLGLMSAFGGQPFPQLPAATLVYSGPYEAIDRQIALFGQTDLSLTDTLKLTTGLRVSSIRSSGNEYFVGALVGPVPVSASSTLKETPVTPKLGLSWQPDVDNMFYVSAAKGYRMGGINPNLGTLCAIDLANLGLTSSPETYKSDSLWSYEVGSKNSLLNRSLQVNSSAFYVDWKNIQQSVYLPNCGNQFAANLGTAVSKGADTSIRYKPVPSLLLTFDVAYTNARYSQTLVAGVGAAPVVTKGNLLTPSPWNFNVAADYKIPGFDDVKPYLHADYQVNTRQNGLTPGMDPNNGGYDPNAIGVPQTANLGMRAGATWGGWDMAAFVTNLTNSEPLLVHQHDTVASDLYFDRSWRPRTIGLSVNYRY